MGDIRRVVKSLHLLRITKSKDGEGWRISSEKLFVSAAPVRLENSLRYIQYLKDGMFVF